MPTGIWEDTPTTFQNVLMLISREMELRYAGWRIAGDPVDATAEKVLYGIAGRWAYDTLEVVESEDGVPELVVTNDGTQYHNDMTVVGAEDADLSPRMELLKSMILRAELPPEVKDEAREINEFWEGIDEEQACDIGLDAIMESLLHGVPLVFIAFTIVAETGAPYLSLWHPCTFTPQDSFDLIRGMLQDEIYSEMVQALEA
jgi:hypothetical protein